MICSNMKPLNTYLSGKTYLLTNIAKDSVSSVKNGCSFDQETDIVNISTSKLNGTLMSLFHSRSTPYGFIQHPLVSDDRLPQHFLQA